MAGGRTVSADDLGQIRRLNHVKFDTTGSRVAFTVSWPDLQTNTYRSQIMVTQIKTGLTEAWTLPDQSCYGPGWSPDGQWLSYLAQRSGALSQLYLKSSAGGTIHRLTDLPGGVEYYAWSPDGRWVVVVSPHKEPVFGPSRAREEDPLVIDSIRYKAEGRGFIGESHRALFLLRVNDQTLTPLTSGEYDDIQPAWAPDSRHIAFISARHDSRDVDLGQDVFVLDITNGAVRQVTRTQGSAAWPQWSPDGTKIAYVGTNRLRSQPNHRRLWAVHVFGGKFQQLVSGNLDRTAVVFDDTPCVVWQSLDDLLAPFEDAGKVAYFKVNVTDGAIRRHEDQQLWQVNAFDFHRDTSTLAFVASSPTKPPELYVKPVAHSDDQAVCLTSFHDQWRDEVMLSTMQDFEAISPDGTVVPCWVMRPASYVPGQVYPALLTIHGGPFMQYGYDFNFDFQYWCSLGYAVVFCNPRGSSGYGENWARNLGTHRGVSDYQDVMACVATAQSKWSFIDPTRWAVLGHSYGGYMTNWLIGHTGQFRVACSEAAPVNLYSTCGTSDLAATNYPFVMGFTAQEDPWFYMQRSPLAFADRMSTPLLILHGEYDLRVNMEQSEQLFTALKLLGKEVRFIRFPGENHRFPKTGTPRHRILRLQYIREWFEKHIDTSC